MLHLQHLQVRIVRSIVISPVTSLRTFSTSADLVSKRVKKQFEAAVRSNDTSRALLIKAKYEGAGGQPELWMYNELLFMYARKRQVHKALRVAEQLQSKGLEPNAFTYGGLLNACAKAELRPYDLPKQFAEKAAAVFDEMQTRGISPNRVHFHSLLDAQAKAGLVDEAFAMYERMQQQGIPATGLTLNILLSACSRAGQPMRATETLERMLKLEGVKADTATWNTMLSAFARANDMDGAYQAWLQMQRSEVVPDQITMKMLAQAFQGNATLANELVQEAAEARSDLLQGRYWTGGLEVVKGRYRFAPQQQLSQPFLLDLHGLSLSAARMALLKRLDYLAMHHISRGQGAMQDSTTDEEPQSLKTNIREGHRGGGLGQKRQLRDLIIITGAATHSKPGQAQHLQEVTLSVLQSRGLQPRTLDPINPGRLVVDAERLQSFLDRQRVVESRGRFLHSAGMQAVMLGVGICSLGAAAYLVPSLLSQTS